MDAKDAVEHIKELLPYGTYRHSAVEALLNAYEALRQERLCEELKDDAVVERLSLRSQLAECREKLEAAEREHAVELENVEDLAKAIGKLSMKVLGYEHYCQSPAELLVRVEDYIDAASERAARVERAGLKLVEDIMDSLPHVDCIADMWLRDGIKKFKRSLEEQNDKD
jgi:hypothetical protein